MTDRFVYYAYGLYIRADFALWPWGCVSSPGPRSADSVLIELAGPKQAFGPLGFRPGLMDAVLDWPGVGSFSISQGRTIQVRPAAGAAVDDIALIAAGPALALLLEQRGLAVLHGSCVDVGGYGTALLGASGVGKSTIAATLSAGGHALLSDGMTVVDVSGARLNALPGPPHLKLWPDAIESVSRPPKLTLPLARSESKLWYQAGDLLALAPVPLRHAVLVQSGAGVHGERLGPAAGLVGLVKNYFLADFIDSASREFVMRRCMRVAEAVVVSALCRGAALSDLSDVVDWVRTFRPD